MNAKFHSEWQSRRPNQAKFVVIGWRLVLVASKFLKIVLGGTAALHTYLVWGAVIFLS
jgi:hypothetical protein